MGENVAHTAYEKGREMKLINDGYSARVFTGPADERARPWHMSLIGEVFTWNTQQSTYAEKVLKEPRCRHRAEVYYDDPKKDVPKEEWEKLKRDAGLFWNETKNEWDIK